MKLKSNIMNSFKISLLACTIVMSGAVAFALQAAPEAKKDRTAAARQRRCRKKQRQHDSHGVQTETGVTERDSERDGVTTAPALPQLDLQNGGQNQALTH